jgi:hypothetical protein
VTAIEFQEKLRLAVSLGDPGKLRDVIAAGAAEGYGVCAPMTGLRSRKHSTTALHVAALCGEVRSVEVLLEAGADVNARDSRGDTALHSALELSNAPVRRAQVLDALLRRGAEPNATGAKNETPLHRVMLIHSERNWKGSVGTGPVPAGTRKAKEAVVAEEMLPLTRRLIAAGADPDFVPAGVRSSYRTPFQFSVMRAVVSQMRLMLEEYGVDPTQKTLSKKSMLAIAGSSTVQTLLSSYITSEKVSAAIEPNDGQIEARKTSPSALAL